MKNKIKLFEDLYKYDILLSDDFIFITAIGLGYRNIYAPLFDLIADNFTSQLFLQLIIEGNEIKIPRYGYEE